MKYLLAYNGGAVSAPLPIKLLPLASPSRHVGENQRGGCEEWMPRRSQTGQAWLELQNQSMQRRRDWGPWCANYPRNIAMFLPWFNPSRVNADTDGKLKLVEYESSTVVDKASWGGTGPLQWHSLCGVTCFPYAKMSHKIHGRKRPLNANWP